jgi:hypothetical protein
MMHRDMTEMKSILAVFRSSRSAASYEANRALFQLLLSAPYRARLSARAIQANRATRHRRSLPPSWPLQPIGPAVSTKHRSPGLFKPVAVLLAFPIRINDTTTSIAPAIS